MSRFYNGTNDTKLDTSTHTLGQLDRAIAALRKLGRLRAIHMRVMFTSNSGFEVSMYDATEALLGRAVHADLGTAVNKAIAATTDTVTGVKRA